jgi:hypothetical protein
MKITKSITVIPMCFAVSQAFTVAPAQRAGSTARFAGDYVPLEGEGKINLKVRSIYF